jgi:GGDEF domain-containing protein
MWNRSLSRNTTRRTTTAVSSTLVSLAVIAGAASAQSLPATDALPSGGVDLTTSPGGAKLGVDAGDTGGVTVSAGPGGVVLGLRTTPKQSAPPAEPGGRVSVPGGPTEDPRSGTSPGQSLPSAAPGRSVAVTGPEPGRAGGAAAGRGGERSTDDRSAGSAVLDGLRPAAAADRDGNGGVAPVFDLIERIPAAVRAGLVALALIAIALWVLWVRGRRRLERNAYVDPDIGVANMEAFEQVLEREWQRAMRYRRPLGLLLLDVEQSGAGGIRLLGEREARDAVDDINKEIRESDTVARLAQSRFAVICPEAPQGSVETLAHALELRLEERRLRCWAGFAERGDGDGRPTDLVTRVATALADAHIEISMEEADPYPEHETVAFPAASGRAAA